MATKRGICPYCKNANINNSIFLVNPEAVNCFCGSNMHQITPKEAIDAYNKYIKDAIKEADDLLEITCDPNGAYEAYADIIDIDDSFVHAYLGRILCLIYLSKTRKSYLDEARILLETDFEKPIFSYLVNAPIIFSFFRMIVRVTEEYMLAVKKALTFKKYFYDTDCLELYLKHFVSSLELDKTLLDFSYEIQKKDSENHEYDAFIKFLEDKIREKEKTLNDHEFITTDGMSYKFYKVDTLGNAEAVILSKQPIDTKCSHYRMATLDKENKDLRYISDEIFKDYTKIIRARKIALVFMIIAYVLFALAGLFIYLFESRFTFFILSIVLAAILFITGTALLILILSWSGEINRKRRKMGAI